MLDPVIEHAKDHGPISTLAELKQACRWLTKFAANVTSQKGEDGIVAKALSMLPNVDHWCVEFGAWDGKYASNTYSLVERQNYNAILIEGSGEKYRQLQSDYPYKDRAVFVNAFVGWSPKDKLDLLLGQHSIPKDFDFLSIDIDGNDYHVWQALQEFRPKLVLIEYNYTIANSVDFRQPADPDCQQGSSATALVRLAKEKKYELIAVTDLNLLFVDSAYYALFAIPDNSLEVMRDERSSHVFFGYDGTVLLDGPCALEWHPGLRLEAKKIQVLPRIFRCYPANYTTLQRRLYRLYSLCTKPRKSLGHFWSYLVRRRPE